MADAIHWTCPYCGRDATIREDDYDNRFVHLGYEPERTKYGDIGVSIRSVVCPNPDCLEITLSLNLCEITRAKATGRRATRLIQSWKLLPESEAKHQPDYIPEPIRENYYEACRIRDLSPKASATLSRRCLQGMIRDFWKTPKQPNLWAEIQAIEDKIDPSTWKAIDAVRKVGKIGAHMEENINVIIDVEPEEAQALIGLIEMLFEDWYVADHEKQQRVAAVIALGEEKEAKMKAGKKTIVAAAPEAAASPNEGDGE